MIESRDLLNAIIVAKMESFSRASEFLHISQPALSQAIKKIEKNIGLPLFIRGKRGSITLTKIGEVLVNEGQPILTSLEELNKRISSTAITSHETLRLGVSFFYISYLLPRILSVFQQKYPDINVEFIEAISEELELLLLDNKVDIAMLPLPLDHSKLEYQVLCHEVILFAMPKNWHLQDKLLSSTGGGFPSIDIADTRDDPYILLQYHPRFELFQDRFFSAANFKPNIRYKVSNWDTVSTFIENGLGVGILPDTMLFQKRKPYTISYCRIISPMEAQRQYVAAYKKAEHLSNTAKNFIRLAKQTLLKYNPNPF